VVLHASLAVLLTFDSPGYSPSNMWRNSVCEFSLMIVPVKASP
jgi:hypothetical protein